MVARPIIICNNLQEGFGHYEKALEDQIQMDWTAMFLKEGLSECRRLINKILIYFGPRAFCSLFWIKQESKVYTYNYEFILL